MRYIIIGLFIIIVLTLQIVVFSNLSVWSIRPDLLLVIAVIWALRRGGREGGVIGALCGLLQDIFSSPIYIHTFTKALLGMILGTFRESIASLGNLTLIAIVFFATIIIGGFEAFILYFFFGKAFSGGALLMILFGGAAYNAVLTPIMIWATSLVSKWSARGGSAPDVIYRLR